MGAETSLVIELCRERELQARAEMRRLAGEGKSDPAAREQGKSEALERLRKTLERVNR